LVTPLYCRSLTIFTAGGAHVRSFGVNRESVVETLPASMHGMRDRLEGGPQTRRRFRDCRRRGRSTA